MISLGEIHKGLSLTQSAKRLGELQKWVDSVLQPWFDGRILPVSDMVGVKWGLLAGEARLRGRHLTDADGLIAATAIVHGLTLVTRNVRDFQGLEVQILNPWQAD